jgi:hypothetical protein
MWFTTLRRGLDYRLGRWGLDYRLGRWGLDYRLGRRDKADAT